MQTLALIIMGLLRRPYHLVARHRSAPDGTSGTHAEAPVQSSEHNTWKCKYA